jgi:SAM-dependent methyltransferase
MSTAAAFESVAPTYDWEFGRNPLAQALRRRVWDALFEWLPEKARVLDLGCGTGIDAIEMVRRGHSVVAVDGSEAMLREVDRKKRATGADGKLDLVRIDLNDRVARRAFFSRRGFDAVLSDFGVLNCVDDLETLAEDVALGLPPRAPLVAVVMGKTCPWDVVYHLLKGRPQRVFVRWSSKPVSVLVGGGCVPVRYHEPRSFCRALRPWFRPRRIQALGAILPPPYLAQRLPRWPRFWEEAARLEGACARWWPVSRLGDHFLAVLERR